MRNQERNIELQKKCIEEFVWGTSLFWLHVLLSMWFSVVFFVFSCPLPKWRVCWMGPILRWLVMIQWVIGRRSPYFPLFSTALWDGKKKLLWCRNRDNSLKIRWSSHVWLLFKKCKSSHRRCSIKKFFLKIFTGK